MKRIAIFASGEGTNTQHLIDFFKGRETDIVLIACNNPNANVLKRAQNSNIPSVLINKEEFYGSEVLVKKMKDEKIDTINKIPLFGDLPLIGFVFRNRDKLTRKTELVIFLTPKIISGDIPKDSESHDVSNKAQ